MIIDVFETSEQKSLFSLFEVGVALDVTFIKVALLWCLTARIISQDFSNMTISLWAKLNILVQKVKIKKDQKGKFY